MCSTLRRFILQQSDEKEDWNVARTEWTAGSRWWSDESAECVCGEHIKERCHIIHNRTRQTLIIGNKCITQFEGLLPLCDRCEAYSVPTPGSHLCNKCRKKEYRPSLIVAGGHFQGKTYKEAFAENKAFCKYELQTGLVHRDPDFAAFLRARIITNSGGFELVEPAKPPPPDYTKILRNEIITFGRHVGKTFIQLVNEAPEYCGWILEQDSKPKNFKGTPIHTYLTAMKK